MAQMTELRKVTLNERHLRPGRTKHTLIDEMGAREFPPFASLVIAQFSGDSGYYLLHLCENGEGTDTWHQNLDDALHQAEWELGVSPEEWIETSEVF